MKNFPNFALILILTIVFASCTEVPIYSASETASVPTLFNKTPTNPPTLIPISTNTFSPIDNYLDKIRKLPEECSYILDYSQKASERNWLAYNCREAHELFMINRDGSKAWQVEYSQISSYSDPDNISIVHWSEDYRFVYFVPSYCCWDPGIMFAGNPWDELWQLDLNSDALTRIMYGFNYVSFSPNDKTILIIPQMSEPPPVIYVYDLESNKISHHIFISAFPNNASAGNVVWYPSGDKFAIMTASGGDYELYEQDAEWIEPLWSVLTIDLNTFSQKVLIEESRKSISLLEITNEEILLLNFNEYQPDGTSISINAQYDIKSKQFLTPTRSP